jgi:signal transduction histidine kinase
VSDGIGQTLLLAGFSALLAMMTYVMGRSVALIWTAWNRLRRTRLLWSLIHAVLVVGLLIAGFGAIFLTIQDFRGRDNANAAQARTETAFELAVDRFMSASAIFIALSIGAIVVVVPPTALLAYVVLRPATRRLEDLAAAARALRAGKLSARVRVDGEDEVARLQADFNAMATELAQAISALQTERDTVARLFQARRELFASVSHELRTPVATVRGYLDSTLEHWDGAPPRTLRHDLAIMARETERLQRLIDDLFMLARTEVGRLPLTLAPTDVAALLLYIAEVTSSLAWERGRVEVLAQPAPGLPPVSADAERLEQVIRNLVANAVRHTPPGGLVVLTAEAATDGVVIQVKDTGEGIPAAMLPHIWERFYRAGTPTERDQGGAGLGLALVKELTEAMGGTVSVASVVGKGTIFTLQFPVAASPGQPISPTSSLAK